MSERLASVRKEALASAWDMTWMQLRYWQEGHGTGWITLASDPAFTVLLKFTKAEDEKHIYFIAKLRGGFTETITGCKKKVEAPGFQQEKAWLASVHSSVVAMVEMVTDEALVRANISAKQNMWNHLEESLDTPSVPEVVA